ncbi:MAG: bifunctional (p)ppGpp synthetase/guanosine-3',5'-bis(diphosphate) 3'-pyrophosphohydrolase, partial [Gemmatimonadetes bacterium]|nr:bifunctional (p)ppGpp synthetase/guanosine-3',5'-bis(diphosphate) 3'-pyrophosphohydrolase [Gemmatimonadota bacterium]
TAIDFAFHVHTDVGFRTTGARVNGRIAPLHRELRNGDTVEVLTSNQARPSRDWLAHVRTGRARSKIKQWIRQEEEAVSQQLGQEILTRELKRRRLELPEADQVTAAARTLNLGDRAALEISLGRGDLAIGQVMRALFPDVPADALQEKPPTMFGRVVNRFRLGRGIRIQGADGLMVRYAQCCQPVPGDPVVGYVTQGRGISIHRAD